MRREPPPPEVREESPISDRENRPLYAGALRILHGAYLAGDISKDSFDETFQHVVCGRSPETTSVENPAGTVLLFDASASTSGWAPVLNTVLGPRSLHLSTETCWEKFLATDHVGIDALLMDPVVAGRVAPAVELLDDIRQKYPAMPVIIFTSLNAVPAFRKFRDLGVFDYFVKELGTDAGNAQQEYVKLKDMILAAIAAGKKSRAPNGDRSTLVGLPMSPKAPVFVNPGDHANPTQVSFAFLAESASAVDLEDRSKTVGEIEDFRRQLLCWFSTEPSDGRSLELRYAADPGHGSIFIALVGSVPEGQHSAGKGAAEHFADDVEQLLRLDPHHHFRWVETSELFETLMNPFPAGSSMQLEPSGFDVDIGCGRPLRLSRPFREDLPTHGMEAFLRLMLAQHEPTVLSLRFHRRKMSVPKDVMRSIRVARGRFSNGVESLSDSMGFLPGLKAIDRAAEIPDQAVLNAMDFLLSRSVEAETGKGFITSIRFMSHAGRIPSTLGTSFVSEFPGGGSTICAEKGDAGQREGRSLLPDEWRTFLSVPQALSLFRFPLPGPGGVCGMKQENLKIVAIPGEVRETSGKAGTLVFAEGFYGSRHELVPVSITEEDLTKHLYVSGKTGTGKSTLLLQLILSTIRAGHGACVIDPHGDLVREVIPRLPRERLNDIIYFDPIEMPLGLNLLECDLGSSNEQEQIDLILQEFMSLMFGLYNLETMGPVFERWSRAGLITCIKAGKTLVDLPRLFRDEALRKECLSRLNRDLPQDQDVIHFWEHEFLHMKVEERAQYETYVVSKYDRLVQSAEMKRILGQQKTCFDLRRIMDEGKILLASLSTAGRLWDSYLLGMILSSRVQLATLARSGKLQEKRRPFFLFIDEFQKIVSSAGSFSYSARERSLESLLSEARKFGVTLVLANQYVSQLDQGTREAVFGNMGSCISLRADSADAEFLGKRFGEDLRPKDFEHCSLYHGFARLLVNGSPSKPFTIRTIHPDAAGKPQSLNLEYVLKNMRRSCAAQSRLDRSVDDLPLSSQTNGCLKNAGIQTIRDLVERHDSPRLQQAPGFDKKILLEIREALQRVSLALQADLNLAGESGPADDDDILNRLLSGLSDEDHIV